MSPPCRQHSVLLLLAVSQQPATAPRDAPPSRHGAVISGRITERGSGRPLPRIVVTLTRVGRPTPLDITTDDDGRYEFTGLEPGEYVLSAGPDRHHSTHLHQHYGTNTPGLPDVEPARPNLDVAAGQRRSGLDIALWRALAIEGRVVDPWENGMANVAVVVRRIGQRVRPAGSAFTDDRGMYRAYGLAPGRYRVCAEIEGPSDAVSENARLGEYLLSGVAGRGRRWRHRPDFTGRDRHRYKAPTVPQLLDLRLCRRCQWICRGRLVCRCVPAR